MHIDLIMQKENQNTLSQAMTEAFLKKPKKAYFLCGNLRETGFKLIEEEIIDSHVKLFFAIGIDKKNTTRNMLEDMLQYTKDIYYYSNNTVVEFDSNICIFEYAQQAILYIASSKLTEASMTEDIIVYTKICYDLSNTDEAKEYKNQLKELIKKVEKETFTKLDKAKIEELVETKEIFSTRQYVHQVKSISDLLGKNVEESTKKEISKEEIDEVYPSDVAIPKFDLLDLDLDIGDIDISAVEDTTIEIPKENSPSHLIPKQEEKEEDIELEMVEALKEEQSCGINMEEQGTDRVDMDHDLYDENLKEMDFTGDGPLDINHLLFSRANIPLELGDKEEIQEKGTEETDEFTEDELVKVKKLNLNNITNFIYEMPSKTAKGQDKNAIKIPKHILMMMPSFFELNENGNNVEIEGVNFKIREIKLEVVDAKINKKYTDRNAKMIHKTGQSYITFSSDVFDDVTYEEKDIARIIKLSSDIYHIEIISQDMQEYQLWDKLCTQTLKSTTRKYGMM